MGQTVPTMRFGVDSKLCAVSGTAKRYIVAIDNLAIAARKRHAENVVGARNGRAVKCTNYSRVVFPRGAAPQESKYAFVGVVHVDPLKSAAIVIGRMQLRLRPIEPIHRLIPVYETKMMILFLECPIELFVIAPLVPLPNFSAHEEQFLARMRSHIPEQQAVVRLLLPVIAWHLPKQ